MFQSNQFITGTRRKNFYLEIVQDWDASIVFCEGHQNGCYDEDSDKALQCGIERLFVLTNSQFYTNMSDFTSLRKENGELKKQLQEIQKDL